MPADSAAGGCWRAIVPWHHCIPRCTFRSGVRSRPLVVWAQKRGLGPMRVLLIDDDELSRSVLELTLSAAGYEIAEAESGEAALRYLRETSGRFDVVLSDLQMPGMHGPELAVQLRAMVSAPLIAMSGSQPAAERYAGFDTFLLKPFTPEQFGEALRGLGNDGGSEIEFVTVGGADVLDDVLDEATFAQLESMMRPQQISELFTLAYAELATHTERMRTALMQGDAATLEASAHAMKGGFSILGASELRALGARLESGAGTTADQAATLDEIPRAAERLRRMLTARGLQV